jgi:hypothetical protein
MWSIADFLLGLLELEYETKSNATVFFFFLFRETKGSTKKEANLIMSKWIL